MSRKVPPYNTNPIMHGLNHIDETPLMETGSKDSEFTSLDETDLIQADVGQLVAKDDIRLEDVVYERGGQNARSIGHQAFLDKKDVYRAGYVGKKPRKVKHGWRNALIRWVIRRGGRFLKPTEGHTDMYEIMSLEDIKVKIVQNLREKRKKKKQDGSTPLAINAVALTANRPIRVQRKMKKKPYVPQPIIDVVLPPMNHNIADNRPDEDLAITTHTDGNKVALKGSNDGSLQHSFFLTSNLCQVNDILIGVTHDEISVPTLDVNTSHCLCNLIADNTRKEECVCTLYQNQYEDYCNGIPLCNCATCNKALLETDDLFQTNNDLIQPIDYWTDDCYDVTAADLNWVVACVST